MRFDDTNPAKENAEFEQVKPGFPWSGEKLVGVRISVGKVGNFVIGQ